jgi:hypothetical protein
MKRRQTCTNGTKQYQRCKTAQTAPNGAKDAKLRQIGAKSMKPCKQHHTTTNKANSVKTAQTASNGMFKIQNSASATRRKKHQQIHWQPPMATSGNHQ